MIFAFLTFLEDSVLRHSRRDPSLPFCPHTDTEDDHSILRKEVKAAVQSLKKGKTARADNIPAELFLAGGEYAITALTTTCNKIWQTGEWPTAWTQSSHFPRKSTCSSARTTKRPASSATQTVTLKKMDRPGVCQVPEGTGEQGKMEETGCQTICGAPTTLVVKGIDDDDDDDDA